MGVGKQGSPQRIGQVRRTGPAGNTGNVHHSVLDRHGLRPNRKLVDTPATVGVSVDGPALDRILGNVVRIRRSGDERFQDVV